jgi:Glycosyl transferase family 2
MLGIGLALSTIDQPMKRPPNVPAVPVSVVIPAHNAARFIGEALDSVQAQTVRPTEVIVVDDGSTDGTALIARGRAVTVLSRTRGGPSAARNTGIHASSQHWIALLDADDVWEPSKLESEWAAVQACPDVGAVFTDFTEFDSRGSIDGTFFSRIAHYRRVERTEVAPGVVSCDPVSLWQQFYVGNFIAPSTMLVRRDLLLAVGLFDESLTHVEDRECWLRLLAVSKMAAVERPLMRSRAHEANWSRDNLQMILGQLRALDRIRSRPERYPPGAAEWYAQSQPRLYLNGGRLAEERGDVAQARTYYLTAWQVGGGLKPLALAGLCYLPHYVRSTARKVLLRRSQV